MNIFTRGLHLYLSAIGFVGVLVAVWGTNRFVLGRSTAGTGWPLLVGAAGILLLLGLLARRRWVTTSRDDPDDQYHWSSQER